MQPYVNEYHTFNPFDVFLFVQTSLQIFTSRLVLGTSARELLQIAR